MEISTGNYMQYQSERRMAKRQEGVQELLGSSAYAEIVSSLDKLEKYALSDKDNKDKSKEGEKESEKEGEEDSEVVQEESFADLLKKQVQTLRQQLLSEAGGGEEEKTFEEFEKESFARMKGFLKKRTHLLAEQAKLEGLITLFIKQVHEKDRLRENPVVWRDITALENRVANVDVLVEQAAQTSPEAFVTNGLLKLRKGKNTFKRFGVIDTPEVKKIYDEIRNDARKKLEERNGVVVLQGPTGTGKTVFARRLAQEFSVNGEYEFVSAHSKMEPDDLISRLGIVAEAIDPKDVPAQIEETIRHYKENNPEVSEEEISKNVRPLIQKVIERQAGQKVMSTKKILEAVGRAAENGTKVIIDEFNYLPTETIGALNDFMARNNAADGFGIIMTGNIGDEYLKRGDLDPAFINRVLEGLMKIGYPPQELDKPLGDSVLSREDYLTKKEPAQRDLFVAGIIQLLDDKGNLIAPPDAQEKIWDLAQAFTLIQRLAAGENIRNIVDDQHMQAIAETNFKKIFLSYRNFNSIIRSWKMDGYDKEIDYYILNNLIRPASIIAPKEAAQLFYFFQHKGFLSGENCAGINVDSSLWKISGVPTVVEKQGFKMEDAQLKVHSIKDVVENCYGVATPSFAEMEAPEKKKQEQASRVEKEEFSMEMEQYTQKEQKDFSSEENKVAIVCP